MLKKVIVVALAMSVSAHPVFPSCALWELGYKGKAEACVMNIKLPVPNVPVDSSPLLVVSPPPKPLMPPADTASR